MFNENRLQMVWWALVWSVEWLIMIEVVALPQHEQIDITYIAALLMEHRRIICRLTVKR